eukprot:PhM_4_TR811/c0_g1_i1/m.62923/K19676/IFT172; intraflagellar transport protein 172
MQLRHVKTLQSSQNGIARVSAICWSPNGKKLAVADYARSVYLYDDAGDRRDRFNTKPSDPTRSARTYVVRAMMFSPDSSKLAIAQSDCMVFVYKLGLEWNERKSICNKFSQNGAVTCMTWPQSRTNEFVVFGTAEGKVKVGMLRTNKTQTLFPSDSYVVSLASAQDGTVVLSGHLDGTIYRYAFEEAVNVPQGLQKMTTHSTVPYCLQWGEHIVASGNDCKITFYNRDNGAPAQSIDLNPLDDKEVTVAAMSPSGQTLMTGTWNKIRIYNFNMRSRRWEESNMKSFENLYSICSAGWKSDGSKLVVGSLCGAVDVYEACLRRCRYKGTFEFTYVSQNQVIVRRISSGTRIVLKSMYGHEIQKVNIYQDRFLVANTAVTVLLGDLQTCKLSEIQWQMNSINRIFFDNPQVCMLFQMGELCLVEYGRNEVLGTCRTDHIKPSLISVRVVDPPGVREIPADQLEDRRRKVIAYLIDKHTIQLDDLVSGLTVGHIQHTNRIEWLELNAKATKLLYRDKHKQLYLFDLNTQLSSTLLNFCTFVQWVPNSDVVVAQNRQDLCVWYSIDAPDRVAVVTIKGEVEGIERANGKTEVIVDEGVNTCAYGLDEVLIEFGGAMEDADYERACDLLDQIALTPETEAMWQRLSQAALQELKLNIAERCFAALGDVAKARAIAAINKMAQDVSSEGFSGYEHYDVQAQIAILNKEFKRAEQLYLEHSQLEKAMDMWRELHRMDECVALAESRNHEKAGQLRSEYFQWLMDTKQEGLAAEIREKDKKYLEAINLYLQGGMPARAAQVVTTYKINVESVLLESIASALFKACIFEKAGEFFENLDMTDRAVEAYKKGRAYGRAVELSRKAAPKHVVDLEEEWGDWLVHQKKVDVAINHYIEAHKYGKAIEAAITARHWNKAISILEEQGAGDEASRKFFKQIALHFESANNFSDAEKYFVKSGCISDAVGMYTRRGQWDNGMRVAASYLSPQERVQMYVEQAQQLEAVGDYSRAEHLLVNVGEVDRAISMYKQARDFTSVIRLVTEHRHEWLLKTHLALAQQLEKEGNYKQAEHHYVQAKEWAKAVNMYREHNLWDDAIRVAKVHGGSVASKQVIMSRAMSIDAEEGVKVLVKYNMAEVGIEYALENLQFEKALEWSSLCMTNKVPYVYLKYAMYLEDEGKYSLAEEAFIKAGKPREAIDMYIHQHEWVAAMNVADTHDPTAAIDIMIAQARESFSRGDYTNAETLLLKAQSPELLVKMFREAKMYKEAQRVAKDYCPNKLSEISRDMANTCADPMEAASMLDSIGDYNQAINMYLQCGREHTSDVQQLLDGYQRALTLAKNNLRERVPEVQHVVVKKCSEIGQHAVAAQLLEQAGQFQEAVDLYINQGEWDKAQQIADATSQDLSEHVKRQRVKTMVADDVSGDVIAGLDKDAAVESYIKTKDFEKALKVSQGLGDRSDEVRKSVVAQYIQSLIKDKKIEDALQLVAREGMIFDDFRFYKVYETLGIAVISAMKPSFDLRAFNEGIMKLADHMKKTGQAEEDVRRMDAVMRAIHAYETMKIMRANGMNDLAGKLGASLVRLIDVLPCDRMFFDAGMAARTSNMNSTAFVLLNQFLDITDNIEDGNTDSSNLDPSDLAVADTPKTFALPAHPTVSNNESEDARQWVLTKSMDPKMEQTLPTTKCPKCQKFMFEGSCRCPGGHTFEECCVTGYPIIGAEAKVKCRSCHRPAKQSEWNKYVMALKVCPWCQVPQSATFGN